MDSALFCLFFCALWRSIPAVWIAPKPASGPSGFVCTEAEWGCPVRLFPGCETHWALLPGVHQTPRLAGGWALPLPCLQLLLAETLDMGPVWWFPMKSDSWALGCGLHSDGNQLRESEEPGKGYTGLGCSALWVAFPADQVGQLRGQGVLFLLSLLHGTQRPENYGSLIKGCCFPFISHSVWPWMILVQPEVAHSSSEAERFWFLITCAFWKHLCLIFALSQFWERATNSLQTIVRVGAKNHLVLA